LKHSTFTSRFSDRIFWLVLLAALAIGATASPACLAAQESTPAGRTSAAAPASGSQPGSVPSNPELSEKEENNVYRHTPLVQTLARTFHLSVETTARLFEFINFAIIALAIVIPLVRIMPRIIRKRSQTLRHDLESARKVTADANTRLSAVEAKLAKLGEEIAAIRAHVEEESKNDEVRIKATIQEESSRIVAAAEQEIAAAATHAKRGLRHFAADLAIEQAANQLVLTPETDRALIAEFMSDSSKGGQN
jgi:F-type H+-transporting ATPase subunit b